MKQLIKKRHGKKKASIKIIKKKECPNNEIVKENEPKKNVDMC